MNPTKTGQRPLVILVDDDPDHTATVIKSLKAAFPGVAFFHFLTGSGLLERMNGEGLRPDVVIMDFDLQDAGDYARGPTRTREILAIAPTTVVIGNSTSLDEELPPLYETRRKRFMKAGTRACVDKKDGSGALVAELEKWLTEEDEGKWRTGLAVATIGAMLALFWLGLLTAPQLVFSFYTLPVSAVAFLIFAVLFRFDKLPKEISVPAMGGALGMTLLGWLIHLAAAAPNVPAILGGPFLLGLLIYLIFTRR